MRNLSPDDLPKFYHLGLPRSGTSTLQLTLRADDRVNAFPSRFFCSLGWYRDSPDFRLAPDRVNLLSNEGSLRQYGGQFKTLVTIERLAAVRPDAEIILTLREQRAWLVSGYKYGITIGMTWQNMSGWLESAMGVDFISMGHYGELYRALRAHFPAEQIHLFFLEDLREDYEGFFERIYAILGLPMGKLGRMEANRSPDDVVLNVQRRLNRLRFWGWDHDVEGWEKRLFDAARVAVTPLAQALFRSRVEAPIRWGEAWPMPEIEEDFRATNRVFQDLSGENLERRGYLV